MGSTGGRDAAVAVLAPAAGEWQRLAPAASLAARAHDATIRARRWPRRILLASLGTRSGIANGARRGALADSRRPRPHGGQARCPVTVAAVRHGDAGLRRSESLI